MVPGLSLGLPFIYSLAHSVLRRRTKSSWLPSSAGVTHLQPLVSLKVSPNTELRLMPRAFWPQMICKHSSVCSWSGFTYMDRNPEPCVWRGLASSLLCSRAPESKTLIHEGPVEIGPSLLEAAQAVHPLPALYPEMFSYVGLISAGPVLQRGGELCLPYPRFSLLLFTPILNHLSQVHLPPCL